MDNVIIPGIVTSTQSNISVAGSSLVHTKDCQCGDCREKRLKDRIASLESALDRIGYIATMSKSPANLFSVGGEEKP